MSRLHYVHHFYKNYPLEYLLCFLKDNHTKMSLKEILSINLDGLATFCVRTACTMYMKKYPDNFAQHINSWAKFQSNRMIFATAITRRTDGRSDRNAEPKTFSSFNKESSLTFQQYLLYSVCCSSIQ